MILNSAPVLASFFAPTAITAKLGAIAAFCGVVMALFSSSSGGMLLSLDLSLVLVVTAAFAYAASFIWLGVMRQAGESSGGINSTYNLCAFVIVLLFLVSGNSRLPNEILPILGVATMSALRLQVLTIAAESPVVSARVAVLGNLSFLWLAIYELILGGNQTIYYWVGMLLVVLGTAGSQIPHEWRKILRKSSKA